jgi:hypothetical protein
MMRRLKLNESAVDLGVSHELTLARYAAREVGEIMGFPKTAARNREIFVAFLNGILKEDLAAQYNLTTQRIDAILSAERHKIAVSPDPNYRQLRHLV